MEYHLVHSLSEFSSNEPSEDRYFIRTEPGISLYCVIDGHGGCFACDLTQKYLVDMVMTELTNALMHTKCPSDILQSFATTFEKCDAAILQEAVSVQSDPLRQIQYPGRIGCCVALAAIMGGRLYTAHVGDCRVVLCRDLLNQRSVRMSGRLDSSYNGSNDSDTNVRKRCRSSEDSPKHFYMRDFHTESISTLTKPKSARMTDFSEVVDFSSSTEILEAQPVAVVVDDSVIMGSGVGAATTSVNSSSTGTDANEASTALKLKSPTQSPPNSANAKAASSMYSENKSESVVSTVTSYDSAGSDAPETNAMGSKRARKHRHSKHRNEKHLVEADYDYRDYTASIPQHRMNIHCLTKDHCCDDKVEVLGIKTLCPNDPNAIRPSATDKKRFGKHALKRVGGSLSVTRAFGDGYLKLPFLSEEPYSQHVPYITCLPSTSSRLLQPDTDLALVIASDGLWNYMEPVEVAAVLREYLDTQHTSGVLHDPVASTDGKSLVSTALFSGQKSGISGSSSVGVDSKSHTVPIESSECEVINSHPSSSNGSSDCNHIQQKVPSSITAASMLLERCLRNAAVAGGTSYESLLSMPCGPYKRNIVDDITVIVVLLKSSNDDVDENIRLAVAV